MPVAADRPAPGGGHAPPPGEAGAQALELALVMPVVLVVAMLAVTAAQVGLAVLSTHQLAATAARLAAVAPDDDVARAVAGALGAEQAQLDVAPPTGVRRPGDLVTVAVSRRIRLVVVGLPLDVAARAVSAVEDVP